MSKDKGYQALNDYVPLVKFNTSVEALVLHTLRTAITQGAFYPGQELDESAVAEELKISKMPVRQAIAALEVEGLVTKVPRKKVYVTRLDEHDIEEIYTTRIALEEVAIRAAIKRCTKAHLKKIAKNVAIDLSEMDGYVGFLEVDMEFHTLLYEPSGWQRVIKYLQQLRNNTAMYRMLREPLPPEKLQLSLGEHREIFEVYSVQDEEAAAALLRKHTQRTVPSVQDIYKANEKAVKTAAAKTRTAK